MERRPLKSRDTKWAKTLAVKLTARGIKPNQISLASSVFSGIAGIAAYTGFSISLPFGAAILFIVAACCIQLRLLCNLLDGMVAVEGGLKSPEGDLYNEIPDRFSDCLTLVIPAYAFGHSIVALGWLAGVMCIMTAYVRAVGAAAGTPNYYIGPMAKPQRMALMTVMYIALAIETFSPFSVRLFPIALWIILLGGAFTCYRRLKLITTFLRDRAIAS